ncbi:MAG TPA: tetratricopeptide repeat protein [Vicinamibacterales bacterium]|nr:tetratricopeptide repeat protein [Vicinamibacterales bacterium]
MGKRATRRIGGACILLAAVLVLYQSVDAGSPRTTLSQQVIDPPVALSKDWKRLYTPDVTVVGNASEGELRTALKQIEDFRAGLVGLFPGIKMTSRLATTMVVLKDFNTFRTFQPRDERGRRRENVAGYFTTTPTMNYMVLGAFGERDATLEVVFHEYTHFIVQQNFRSLPLWVNEGTADFYSTFRSNYKDGKSLVGTPPSGRLATLRDRGVMPLDRILTNEGSSSAYRDPDTVHLFYAQSWAFVHYLQLGNNGKRRGQITEYLRAVDQGMPIDQAFFRAFGVTLAQMQNELGLYVRQPILQAFLFSPKTTTADVATLAVDRLTQSDAAYVQADLLLQTGATEDAARLLTNVLTIDPSHVDAKIALARVRARQDRRDEAIAALEGITAAKPATFSAQLYLAGMLRSARRYEDAMRAAERAVALDRESTHAWYELNLSALASGRDKEAADALAQIIGRDSNPAWYQSQTYDAYALGRDEAVIRSATAYIRSAGQGNESAPYVGYAAALASMRLGRQAEAVTLLKKIEESTPLGSWQSLVAQFLQGQFSGDKLLDKAKSDGDRTEAHAYIGVLNLVQGKQADALVHLRWVKEHGLKNYVEYRMALAELDRLEAAKAR